MPQTRTALFFSSMFLLVISLADFAHAQNSDQSNAENLGHNYIMLDKIDDLLPISIPLAMIGVSLTGAAFLLSMLGKIDDERKPHVLLAKKELIRGFMIFLTCAVVIFVFDFVEILNERLHVQIILIDIVAAYSLFGVGLAYFFKAAKEIYNTV